VVSLETQGLVRAVIISYYLLEFSLRQANMCTTGISYYVMTDPYLHEIMTRRNLDFLHQQVIMVLYTLQHDKRLHEYRQMLPVYLGRDWTACEPLLDGLEAAGIINRSIDGIELPHQIFIQDDRDACACAT